MSYFNVSGRKRIRLELQSAWRHEFLKDFYWSLNGFESSATRRPIGPTTLASVTLGWTFYGPPAGLGRTRYA